MTAAFAGNPGAGAELTRWTRPWQVRVVVPARNEEAVLAACLRSVRRAAWHARLVRPTVEVRTVVVLDSCTDRTAEVLTDFPEVAVLPVTHGGVGGARAAGVRAAAASATVAADHVWVAGTDADSEVPTDWITQQLDRADRGAHGVIGTVSPARAAATRVAGEPSAVLVRWHAHHAVHEGHPHVHGANLGVRLDSYEAVGGFDTLEEHEDVQLVERLAASGAVLVRTSACRVRTSDRVEGRTPGGFAAYLRGLEGVA